ncbi:MAG: hypothetical protein JSV21_04380 [Nitrospirota bacterium]|nr:MAG: hypothetical protein JSV21_04380 [Nitrospirota bacterium]
MDNTKTKYCKKTCIVGLLLLVAFLLLTSTIAHRYGPYYGRVIDANTKKPIEGAAVLVSYSTEMASVGGPVEYYADAIEVVTDNNGEFRVPANWIIKFRPISWWDKNPSFTIFKPGYGCFPWHKAIEKEYHPGWSLPPDKYVTVELPSVINESRENRLNNATCVPSSSVPQHKHRKLRELLDVEMDSLYK